MKKKISILLVILWMVFIFVMSSFSSTESSNQSNFIVNIIVSIFNIDNVNLVTLIVRKLAHFGEYFILGVLMSSALNTHSKNIFIGIALCFIYAITDEIHQLFIPGRSGQILDVCIDTLGSITSIIIFYIFKNIKNKIIRKHL